MKTTVNRTIAALSAIPCVLALVVAVPANAAPKDGSKMTQTGNNAYVDWTEYDLDNKLGLPGNTHVGFLSVYTQTGFTDIYGAIQDFQCDPGEVPGGGHGEPGGDALCDLEGTRFLSAGPDVAYTADLRARVASLKGTLLVSNGGHGEPGTVLGRPVANITWTADGAKHSFRRSSVWSDGTMTYRSNERGSGFQAEVSGAIGAMGFTDDDDDVSNGGVEQWTERSRMRIR